MSYRPIHELDHSDTVTLVLDDEREVPGYMASTESGRVYVARMGRQYQRLLSPPLGFRDDAAATGYLARKMAA